MRSMLRWSLLLGAVALTGCFGTEETPFPDGLEPLEENMVEPPMGTADNPYPEEYIIELSSGPGYAILLGRGYIHGPITDVWAALRDPAAGADRRTSPVWSSEPVEDERFDDSYVIHHTANEIVTVEWDVTWRHAVVVGTVEEPEVVAIRWQKTDGSTLIQTIEGSLVLRPVGDGSVTELELAYHASATAASTDTYIQYQMDIYNDAVALTHGDPLPEF